MKIKLLLTLLSSLTLLSGVAQANIKVLTIDIDKTFNEFHKVIEARKKFDEKIANANKEVQLMVEEGQGLSKQLQESVAKINNPALADGAKVKAREAATEIQRKLKQKENDINQYRKRMATTLKQRQQNIINLHMTDIKDIINQVAEDKGADLVLNKSGNNVFYSRESYEITSDVIGILNADAPAAK
jgi:Skp family chaperone for outer membrane proteins